MATFSIFENVKITDPKEAEAFVKALEESEEAAKSNPVTTNSSFRMATREDTKRLHELRKMNREIAK